MKSGVAFRQSCFADLVIAEQITGGGSAGSRGDGRGEALFLHLKNDVERLLADREESAKWLARVQFLRRWMPELEFPEMSGEVLDEVLREACSGKTALDQVRDGDLFQSLESRLSWKQKSSLDQHAPTALAAATGNRIRLQYPPGGDAPVMAVRLQELFGAVETPMGHPQLMTREDLLFVYYTRQLPGSDFDEFGPRLRY